MLISRSENRINAVICGLCAIIALAHSFGVDAQTIYQYRTDDATICFFDKNQAQYVPHLMRKYELGRALHQQIWDTIPSQAPFMMLTDWEDDGNAGVGALPHTTIQMGLAPMNMAYFVSPSNERYDHLFKHEYTHVVMSDKTNSRDMGWRHFTGNKVVPDSKYPLSALWSYLDAPRWYAPRWYHEGIACFMETWLGDGAGRALGGYDETYFRTHIKEGEDLYSVVGLETEGTTTDFQQGATSYLYGTRFVNYLVLTYGYDKLIDFYNRTEDSRTFYAKQFEEVYGRPLRKVWEDWKAYEKEYQMKNLEKIAEYPLTECGDMGARNLGASSPMIFDTEKGVAFAAVYYPGALAQVVKFSLDTAGRTLNNQKRLGYVDGTMSYQTAYIAYDRKGQRLIWTDRNSKMRGLVIYDLEHNRIEKHLKYQRTYGICYDNVHDCLYGLISNQGICYLVRYDSSLENRELLYSFPFGVSVSDLDVSHDGEKIVMAVLGKKGEHSLIMFDHTDLENGNYSYKTIYTLEDSNLSQFRFNYDDSKLIGSSYYTGVPNIWSLDLETGDFDLLSNVQTGLFAPYMASDDVVYALKYESDGMRPVAFGYEVLKDANSVEFLGQKAFEANPQLAELSTLDNPLPEISFGEVYDSVKVYKPWKEIRFQGAYPDISGFTDRQSWNNVTPVLGYHVAFYDPLSLFSINLFVGASPWSHNDWKNRFHASAEIKYWQWTLSAAWNPTSFYDLFGPRRASRKGYHVALGYASKHTQQYPFTWDWGASIAHYGDMDALPLYQEIQTDIHSFQTADAYIKGGKVRGTIGAVAAEQGYRFSAEAYTYLADGKLFPSIEVSGEKGFLLPFGRHNSLWLKGSAGQSFGNSDSVFGNSYFGGFRNNYVDNGEVNRYRTINAMPGARIDQIGAHNYLKATGEINFCPIRFNNFGALQCYPNYIQFCVFAHDLATDLWGADRLQRANYVSAGAQMNIQMVFFTHMKTTLSIGYARAWGNGLNQGEFMVSLKLL